MGLTIKEGTLLVILKVGPSGGRTGATVIGHLRPADTDLYQHSPSPAMHSTTLGTGLRVPLYKCSLRVLLLFMQGPWMQLQSSWVNIQHCIC